MIGVACGWAVTIGVVAGKVSGGRIGASTGKEAEATTTGGRGPTAFFSVVDAALAVRFRFSVLWATTLCGRAVVARCEWPGTGVRVKLIEGHCTGAAFACAATSMEPPATSRIAIRRAEISNLARP